MECRGVKTLGIVIYYGTYRKKHFIEFQHALDRVFFIYIDKMRAVISYNKKRQWYVAYSWSVFNLWELRNAVNFFLYIFKSKNNKLNWQLTWELVLNLWDHTKKVIYSRSKKCFYIEIHIWENQVCSAPYRMSKKAMIKQCDFFWRLIKEKKEWFDKIKEHIEKNF